MTRELGRSYLAAPAHWFFLPDLVREPIKCRIVATCLRVRSRVASTVHLAARRSGERGTTRLGTDTQSVPAWVTDYLQPITSARCCIRWTRHWRLIRFFVRTLALLTAAQQPLRPFDVHAQYASQAAHDPLVIRMHEFIDQGGELKKPVGAVG